MIYQPPRREEDDLQQDLVDAAARTPARGGVMSAVVALCSIICTMQAGIYVKEVLDARRKPRR